VGVDMVMGLMMVMVDRTEVDTKDTNSPKKEL
jgi:hypothetical protein